jgi:two-component system, chemotaxis family, CheB/CheR fusion protein
MTINQPDPQFEALLLYLKEARGFDFTGYKRSSLMRRVGRRMAGVGMNDYAEYQDYLELHPDEFTALFNTILINVTGFFRDPDAWEFLRNDVIKQMLENKPTDAPVRVWSAGCASGEEAYTLAMMFAELMGPDHFRRRVKIYATDVDEEGLTQARHASYSEREVKDLPDGLVDRYFEKVANRYVFRKDLRRSVIFGRNDLIQDAPISRIDLLVCRNTLMYFNAETQARILSRCDFALAEGGVLFLGKAEMLLSHSSLFLPVDLKRRIFCKVARFYAANGSLFSDLPQQMHRTEVGPIDQLRNEAFQASPVAQIVLTADGLVALANRQAESLFGVTSRDVGRPFRDLDVSYRPLELRRFIDEAQVERRMTRAGEVEHQRGGELISLYVQLNPLVDGDGGLLGVALIFHDVTGSRRLQDDLEKTNRQLATAYEELQSTNEELETTNEELQATVEELETTNEELQSTNEELETMNEELQSTNDELQNINELLRSSTDELDGANAFMEAVLTSLRVGVAVLTRELQIRVWNRRAEDLWGLRREETIGEHFLNLDIGLPIEQLRPAIRKVLNDSHEPQEALLPAVNRRGRSITVRVVCMPLRLGDDGQVKGAILVMEPVVGPATEPAETPADGSPRH